MLMLRRLKIIQGKEEKTVEQKERHGAWDRKHPSSLPAVHPWDCMSPCPNQSFSFLICDKRAKCPPVGIL